MREMVSLFANYMPICKDTFWEKWYQLCMETEKKYDFRFTHIGCKTKSLNPNGIRTRNRYLSKVETCIYDKEDISHLGFYVLPDKFQQAVFDFKVYMGLACGKNSHCEITVENHFFSEFQYESFINNLITFLHIINVEVNILPNTQVFNYNFNCALGKSTDYEEYNLIRTIYKENI